MPVSTKPVAKPAPSARLQMLLVMMRQQRQSYGGKLAG
jgi:hypothetical protein